MTNLTEIEYWENQLDILERDTWITSKNSTQHTPFDITLSESMGGPKAYFEAKLKRAKKG